MWLLAAALLLLLLLNVGSIHTGHAAPHSQQQQQQQQQQSKQKLHPFLDPLAVQVHRPYRLVDLASDALASHTMQWMLRVMASYGYYPQCTSPEVLYGFAKSFWTTAAAAPNATTISNKHHRTGSDQHEQQQPQMMPLGGSQPLKKCDNGDTKCKGVSCRDLIHNNNMSCAYLSTVWGLSLIHI